MEWNRNNLIKIVEFINKELNNGKPMVKIEKESFGENERVIHKRLIRLGYKKIVSMYYKMILQVILLKKKQIPKEKIVRILKMK